MTETTAPATTLDDIVAPGFVADPDRFANSVSCNGINHSDHATRGTCPACGAAVASKGGGAVFPLRIYTTPGGYERTAITCYRPRHACDPARVAAHRAAVLVDLDAGQLYVRFPVRVVKGRKVPVGTVGVLTWVGEGDYGLRVGLRDVHGTVHWTAASNVELHVTGELARQVADRQAEIAAAELAAARLRGDREILASGADVVGWLVELLDDGVPVAPTLPILRLHVREGGAFAVEVGTEDAPVWLFGVGYGQVWRFAQR